VIGLQICIPTRQFLRLGTSSTPIPSSDFTLDLGNPGVTEPVRAAGFSNLFHGVSWKWEAAVAPATFKAAIQPS
jgi:hypothetical protein